MSIWFYELFGPEALVRNLALFLVVVALAMPTLGLVRLVALAGGVVGIILTGFVAFDRAGLFWWALMTVVVAIRLTPRDGAIFGRRLTPEENDFHRKILPALSERQVRLLLKTGQWRDADRGHVFTEMGAGVTELIYLSRGRADVEVDKTKVAEVSAGSLIGEIGISTGEVATATTVANGDIRFLSFNIKQLYPFLDSHVQIQDAIELAVDRSLRNKLAEANRVAAHSGDTGVG
jgi:CRP-like cAMP-binding protein